MHVLVVHNRYSSAQPSGENKVVDQEVGLLREAGHRVEVFERRSDDIAARSLLAKAAVPLPGAVNRAVRAELANRLRTAGPDVVHVHNVFPLLSPAVLAACADAGVPAVATLHNYTQVCPPGRCAGMAGPPPSASSAVPLPAVRHGCYLLLGLADARARSACRPTGGAGWSAWSGSSASPQLCATPWGGKVRRSSGGGEAQLRTRQNPTSRRREHLLLSRPGLAEAKGRAAAHGRLGTSSRRSRGVGVPLVIAGSGPRQPQVTAWAAGPARRALCLVCTNNPRRGEKAIARSVAVRGSLARAQAFGLVVVEAFP